MRGRDASSGTILRHNQYYYLCMCVTLQGWQKGFSLKTENRLSELLRHPPFDLTERTFSGCMHER